MLSQPSRHGPLNRPEEGRLGDRPPSHVLEQLEVCELARTIVQERPDRAQILAEREPMPPEAEAAWQRLVLEGRRDGAAR